jgi:hypothetical protein
MGVSLAVCLDSALGDVTAASLAAADNPLRLELPPDAVDEATLEPRAAAALGSLYLLSELEQLGVVPCAELLVDQRYSLSLRDQDALQRIEDYATKSARRPRQQIRRQLFSRLFGAAWPDDEPTDHRNPVITQQVPANHAFEELLAGYCDALVAFDIRKAARSRTALKLAGDRLRANLAPRQYGNTLLIATPLVEQLRASLDLLALPGLGEMFGVNGAWAVVRAMQPDLGADIGRRVDRGQSGRDVVKSSGYPPVPDLVDAALVHAADVWLSATGFTSGPSGTG